MMSSIMQSYFLKFLEQEEYMTTGYIDRGLNPILYSNNHDPKITYESRNLYWDYVSWENPRYESVSQLDNFSLLNFIQLIYLSETDLINHE